MNRSIIASIGLALCMASCSSASSSAGDHPGDASATPEAATPHLDAGTSHDAATSSTIVDATMPPGYYDGPVGPQYDGPPLPENEAGALEGECPSGFAPQSGMNSGFISDGVGREFYAALPTDTSKPAPVFVALTGTVQTTTNFLAQSALDGLPQSGWIVLAPVRTCEQDNINCNGPGTDGRVWEPWYDGTSPPKDDPGPDARFVESMVRCAATKWPVDAHKIYVGGISAGGSFTNHLMTYDSDFFAGAVDSSGDWYGGNVLPKDPQPMSPSIVIVTWGGPTDQWPATNPLAIYSVDTAQASQYYSSQKNVLTISCTNSLGHVWPEFMTDWMTQTILSFPKGSDPSTFVMTPPPSGATCVMGPYTDHDAGQ